MSFYGIDLGTTYACIAKVDDNGEVAAILNWSDQSTTLASAVFFDDEGNYIVGDAAKECIVDAPDRLCQFFMRYIGRPELLARARENEPNLYIIDGVERDPVELAAMVLKKMLAYCMDQGEEVHEAVLAYPAYFDISQKEALRKAAELAGINVLGMISDVNAAAVNYCHGIPADNVKILLYHLGGSTFTTSLIQLQSTPAGGLTIRTHGYNGDNDLGGVNWDQALEVLVKRKLAEEIGCSVDDISQDVTLAIRLEAERRKQALTGRGSVTFKFTDDDGIRRKIPVTLEEFDEVTRRHLNITICLVQKLLSENAMDPKDVDVVLLDGGSTLMPQVRGALSEMFDEDKIVLSDPYQAVAKGAAIIAENINKCGSPNVKNAPVTIEPFLPEVDVNRSPISFGFILADDFDEAGNAINYKVHNFLTVGEKVPLGEHVFSCFTSSKTQSSLAMILATSLSPDKVIPVKRAADNTFYSEDTSIDLKTIVWRISISTPHVDNEYIIIWFGMNRDGEILLSAESPAIGCSELELRYHKTYTIERLNVNGEKR